MGKFQAFAKKLFDKTFWKFILVGVVNTLFGTAIMFLFYNLLHLSYWLSSASNYFFGSILSYFLNKYFTFQNKSRSWKTVLRFAVNIAACYLVAYGLARPLIRLLMRGCAQSLTDNVAMVLGMCIFVALNYLSQRFLTFRERPEERPASKNRPLTNRTGCGLIFIKFIDQKDDDGNLLLRSVSESRRAVRAGTGADCILIPESVL